MSQTNTPIFLNDKPVSLDDLKDKTADVPWIHGRLSADVDGQRVPLRLSRSNTRTAFHFYLQAGEFVAAKWSVYR